MICTNASSIALACAPDWRQPITTVKLQLKYKLISTFLRRTLNECVRQREFTIVLPISHIGNRLDTKARHVAQLFHGCHLNGRHRCDIKLGITPFSVAYYFLVKRKLIPDSFAKKLVIMFLCFANFFDGMYIQDYKNYSLLFLLIHKQSCI